MYLCGAGHPERTHEDWEQIGYDKGYKKGRSDQGELNADTIREIHELVYQQGIEKGRVDAIEEFKNEILKEDYLMFESLESYLNRIAKQLRGQSND